MKRRWETPKAMVEEFEANEYVAACYSVVCNVDAANEVEKNVLLRNGLGGQGGILVIMTRDRHTAQLHVVHQEIIMW